MHSLSSALTCLPVSALSASRSTSVDTVHSFRGLATTFPTRPESVDDLPGMRTCPRALVPGRGSSSVLHYNYSSAPRCPSLHQVALQTTDHNYLSLVDPWRVRAHNARISYPVAILDSVRSASSSNASLILECAIILVDSCCIDYALEVVFHCNVLVGRMTVPVRGPDPCHSPAHAQSRRSPRGQST